MTDSEMSMWHWGAGGMSPEPHDKEARARTDSDLGLHLARNRNGAARERSHTLSDVKDLHAVGQEFKGPYLTVMLRNLPNNYTRAMLLKLIDSEGFGGKYDFVYLVM